MALASLTIDINARLANIEKDMGKVAHIAEQNAERMRTAFGVVGGAIAGIASGLSVGAFVSYVKGIADAGDELNKLSQRAGMSAEELSKLQFAAGMSGVSNEDLAGSLDKLNKAIGTSDPAFARLGISLKSTDGQSRNTGAVLGDLAEKFRAMEDGPQKTALAIDVFGKSGAKLIPFLNAGKDGLAAFGAEAERLGIVMSGDLAAKSEALNDNIDRLGKVFDAIKINVGSGLIPLLSAAIEEILGVGGAAETVGGKVRSGLSPDAVKEWAKSTAQGAAVVVDGFRYVTSTVQATGIALAALAAEAVALAQGNLDGFNAIREQAAIDIAAAFNFESATEKVDKFFSEFDRSVRVNGEKIVLENAETAASVQKIYDDYFAQQKAGQARVTVFTDEQLKIQEKLRKDAAESAQRTAMGETEFAIAKLRERYQIQFDAIRGLSDEQTLRADLEKRLRDEIDAVYKTSADKRIALEQGITAAVSTESHKRVAVEIGAANAVAAARIGVGAIRNAGGPGEFVSSWDDAGNYVGNLGRFQLDGFASGGSFMVGGSGGTDSQIVAFRASPDEKVTIETPSQQRSSGGITIGTINLPGISNAREFVAELRQMLRTDPGLLGPGMARAG